LGFGHWRISVFAVNHVARQFIERSQASDGQIFTVQVLSDQLFFSFFDGGQDKWLAVTAAVGADADR
jgi:hypothetical protein